MNLAAWLLTIVGPLARQVLIALGFGFVTYVGVDAALTGALDAARGSFGGMAELPAALMAMAGGNTALGILAGALSARVAFVQARKLVPHAAGSSS